MQLFPIKDFAGLLSCFFFCFLTSLFSGVASGSKKSQFGKLQKATRIASPPVASKLSLLTPQNFQLLPLESRYNYLKHLRSTYLAIIKDFQNWEGRFQRRRLQRKGADHGPEFPSHLYSLLDSPLFSRYWSLPLAWAGARGNPSWRAKGKVCFYAGYASEYIINNKGNITCKRPTEENSSDYKNSWDGEIYCGPGQILCNPLLFGLGNNGNGRGGKGYCVRPGRHSFDNCQKLYYKDPGYPARRIAEFLMKQAESSNDNRDPLLELVTNIGDFCENIKKASRRFSVAKRNCIQFSKRTRKLTEEIDSILAKEEDSSSDGSATASSIGTSSSPTSSPPLYPLNSCRGLPRWVFRSSQFNTHNLANNFKPDFSCASCLFEHLRRTNNPELRKTDAPEALASPSMMILLSIVAKYCPGPDGQKAASGPNPQRVFQMLERFGSCPKSILPPRKNNQSQEIFSSLVLKMTQGKKMTQDQKSIEGAFKEEYGISPKQMQKVFCPDDNNLQENSHSVMTAIDTLPVVVEEDINRRRSALQKCLKFAKEEKQSAKNSCKLAQEKTKPKNTYDTYDYNTVFKNQRELKPSFFSLEGGACLSLLGILETKSNETKNTIIFSALSSHGRYVSKDYYTTNRNSVKEDTEKRNSLLGQFLKWALGVKDGEGNDNNSYSYQPIRHGTTLSKPPAGGTAEIFYHPLQCHGEILGDKEKNPKSQERLPAARQ